MKRLLRAGRSPLCPRSRAPAQNLSSAPTNQANPAPEIVRGLYRAGASFDVASLPEFMLVYENIQHLPAKERQDFIWDKIVYANPIKPKETLQALDQYKPLVTYDKPERAAQNQAVCPARGTRTALARAQHRLDGRALL